MKYETYVPRESQGRVTRGGGSRTTVKKWDDAVSVKSLTVSEHVLGVLTIG